MARSGFKPRVARRAQSGMTTDPRALGKKIKDWVLAQREAGTLDLPIEKIGSIDFVFTRHITSNIRSYAPSGR